MKGANYKYNLNLMGFMLCVKYLGYLLYFNQYKFVYFRDYSIIVAG